MGKNSEKKTLDQFLTLDLDQFLTHKRANFGPASNSRAYLHTYIYISIKCWTAGCRPT